MEVAVECVLGTILPFTVGSPPRHIQAAHVGRLLRTKSRLTIEPVLKTIVAAIYTNYETTIVDDEGIEQEDAFLAGPVGRKLVLTFSFVGEQK